MTMLYRSTDRRRRCGAPVLNRTHSASFHACWNSAPSNPGTEHPSQRPLRRIPAVLLPLRLSGSRERFLHRFDAGGALTDEGLGDIPAWYHLFVAAGSFLLRTPSATLERGESGDLCRVRQRSLAKWGGVSRNGVVRGSLCPISLFLPAILFQFAPARAAASAADF